MDNTFYKQYKIFVSSPGDVKKEREIVDIIVSKINESIGESLKVNLKVVMWEKLPPETTIETIQDRLNQKVSECHFFLLILNKRYGTIQPGHKISNTEREINTILEHLNQNGKKTILSYFKDIPNNEDPGKQEKQIRELRNKLASNPCWLYSPYKDVRDFERLLTHDLYRILLRMNSSSFKIDQLKKFWRAGKLDGQPIPRIAIVYPPVPKVRMSPLDINLWQKRLLPHLFYEDHKALHKILKNLSMVGHQDYRVYSKYDLPNELDQVNVIWICLPRLKKGMEELRHQEDRKFDIVTPKDSDVQESHILWNIKGKPIKVDSPLRKYLKAQRKGIDPDNDWDITLNKIVVKDYAIISRFDRLSARYNYKPNGLKSFFIAGIHGLGTWGATWYIDRRYEIFKEQSLEGNIQILVEVEYRDGRIYNVVDVSDCSQEYFENENKPSRIRQLIKQYKEE